MIVTELRWQRNRTAAGWGNRPSCGYQFCEGGSVVAHRNEPGDGMSPVRDFDGLTAADSGQHLTRVLVQLPDTDTLHAATVEQKVLHGQRLDCQDDWALDDRMTVWFAWCIVWPTHPMSRTFVRDRVNCANQLECAPGLRMMWWLPATLAT